MGKRRIKVFASGNYPQGNYSVDRVKEIFSGIKDKVQGIFVHTSKWKNENKEPIELGQFDNFSIKENGEQAEVYADINFNDKGNNYYNDGIFKGVSVEIDPKANKLDKIAILPIGTNPAVQGAEFQEEEKAIINFMEVEELDEEKKKELLKNLTIEDIRELKLDGYNINITETDKEESTPETAPESPEATETVTEVKKVEEVQKNETREEMEQRIREELKQEYEQKAEVNKKVSEFMKVYERTITPAIGKVLNEKTLKDIFTSEAVVEFEEKSISIAAFLNEFMKVLPKFNTGGMNLEFNEVEKNKTPEAIAKEYKEKYERILKK